MTVIIPKKNGSVQFSAGVAVKMAKDSSVTPKAASSRAARPLRGRRWLTQALMMTCRRLSRKVVRMMAASPAPCATMPTAIIWLAPAKTDSDMSTVSAAVKPACRAMTA